MYMRTVNPVMSACFVIGVCSLDWIYYSSDLSEKLRKFLVSLGNSYTCIHNAQNCELICFRGRLSQLRSFSPEACHFLQGNRSHLPKQTIKIFHLFDIFALEGRAWVICQNGIIFSLVKRWPSLQKWRSDTGQIWSGFTQFTGELSVCELRKKIPCFVFQSICLSNIFDSKNWQDIVVPWQFFFSG